VLLIFALGLQVLQVLWGLMVLLAFKVLKEIKDSLDFPVLLQIQD